eukprot:1012214-Prymnesium_polylepis.1
MEELSPGVYGWKGAEALRCGRGAAAAASASAVVELLNQVGDTKVFLGLAQAASDASLLQAHSIEHIIAVGAAPPPCKADVMGSKVVKLGDLASAPLLGHLPKLFDFIDSALEEGGLLVHSSPAEDDGDEDESASTAVVVGWLLARQGVPFAEAPQAVAANRPSAALNANFEKQLRVWTTWK